MIKSWYSRITSFYRHQNNQQYITLFTSIITEFIGISISNLALWFIPQSNEYSYGIILELPTQKWYIINIMLVNCISWIVFIIVIMFEIFREMWLIRTFDYSRKYSSVHLTKYKNDYPDIFHILEWYNNIYYKIYIITKWIWMINNLFSWVVIVLYQYAGYKTITALFMNSLICYNKISKGIQIGKDSKTQGIGYSYHNTLNLSYNRIDARIKKHISNSNVSISGTGGNGNNLSVSRIHSRRNSIVGGSGNASLNASLNASWNSTSWNNKIPGIVSNVAGIEITISDIEISNVEMDVFNANTIA